MKLRSMEYLPQIIRHLLLSWLISNAVFAVEVTVQTKPIKYQDQYQTNFPVLGIIQPVQQTSLVFETQGKITTITKDIGDYVERGEILATLDCSDKKAQLDLAHAIIAQGEVKYKQALRDQTRSNDLFASEDISVQIKEQSDNAVDISKSELTVLQATSVVNQVQYNHCFLRAPWSGKITKRPVEIGQFVTFAQHIFELQSTALEVQSWLPMRFAPLISGQDKKSVQAKAAFSDSDTTINIKLKQSSGVIDPQRLAILTKWNINTNLWNIGKSIIINIEQIQQAKGFWIDRSAVTNSIEGLLHIFVINDDNQVENYQVELLHTEQNQLYVTGPVPDGFSYVSLGSQLLVAGQTVITTTAK